MYLLAAWILFSLPIFILGSAIVSLKADGDNAGVSTKSKIAAFTFFMPLWWGVYFAIMANR